MTDLGVRGVPAHRPNREFDSPDRGQRWEYKIIRARGDEIHANERHLNDLGADTDDATGGWELVAVVAYTATHYLYLRRVALAVADSLTIDEGTLANEIDEAERHGL